MSTERLVDHPDHFFLGQETEASRRALETGFLVRGDEKIPVRAVAFREQAEGPGEILFRRRAPAPARGWAEKIGRFFVIIRGFSLTATVMPCFAVLMIGSNENSVRAGVALSAMVGVVFLQVAVNLYNDVTDYLKLIDLPGSPGGSGVFERGWFTPNEIRAYARIAAAVGFVAGIPAIVAHPFEIFLVGGLGLLGTFLYSHGKLGLKYHALGDLAVFALCGPALTLGFSYAAFGQAVPGIYPIGSILGLLACALLHMNNLHDMEIDRSRGVVTLAIRLGYRRSVALLGAMYAAAISILITAVVLGALPVGTLAALGAFVPATKLYRRVRSALGPTSPTLEGSRMVAAQTHLLAGLLLSAGIFASRWMGG